MANMKLTKTAMSLQDAEIRCHNFEEVALGYKKEEAMEEAMRCLHCAHAPCISGCPVGIQIPSFIEQIAKGNEEEAYRIIALDSALPAVCGRVCPQESQCESKCVRGIKGEAVAIGRLERYAADAHLQKGKQMDGKRQNNGHKIAIVGAGPSGLTCAKDLAMKGYAVTIFEALHEAGGVLVYGIPEFRLPKTIVQHEIEGLKQLGVRIETDMVIGRVISVDELMEEEGYEAVYLASGAGLPRFLHLPGENLKGVYSANEFLTRINLMKAYQQDSETPIQHASKVIVVGGGNVAMDAARCARRLGAEVHIVYRRSMDELPARKEEVEHAQEEGIIFDLLHNPICVHGDENGWIKAVECVRMELGEPDESGRRRPQEVKDSAFLIEADCMIVAIGTSPNPLLRKTTPHLETNAKGGIITDENGATSKQGVFAGGDAVSGAATVILAMGAGKKAAAAIDAYVQEQVIHSKNM